MESLLNILQEGTVITPRIHVGAIVNVYLDSVAVFGLLVDPMHNLMTFFGRWLAERRVMKMDKLSLQVLLLHYSKLPI